MERPIITLISDWGWDDVSLGLMKWELYQRFPNACVVDLVHNVELLDVNQTAFMMSRLYQRFPEGSLHLMLTGVSRLSNETPLVVEMEGHYFIGLDNGVFPALFPDGTLQVRRLAEGTGDCLEQMSLLAEACLTHRCQEVTEEAELLCENYLLRYVYSGAEKSFLGHVMYIDSHHNVVTNIPAQLFKDALGDQSFELRLSGFVIRKFHDRYVKECEPYLVPNSLGVLEIVSYGAKLVLVPKWNVGQAIRIEFVESNE